MNFDTTIASPSELLTQGDQLADMIIHDAMHFLKKHFKPGSAVIFPLTRYPRLRGLADLVNRFEQRGWSAIIADTTVPPVIFFSDARNKEVQAQALPEPLLACLLSNGWELVRRSGQCSLLKRPDPVLMHRLEVDRQVLFATWAKRK